MDNLQKRLSYLENAFIEAIGIISETKDMATQDALNRIMSDYLESIDDLMEGTEG